MTKAEKRCCEYASQIINFVTVAVKKHREEKDEWNGKEFVFGLASALGFLCVKCGYDLEEICDWIKRFKVTK